MATAINDLSTQMFEAEAMLFTRTGERLRVRPVRPGDRAAIANFFQHVTSEDLRFRFLTSLREVGDKRLDDICRTDYPTAMTFVAFVANELVALASLAGQAAGRIEVALTTLPQWKAHGISWTLLDHAIRFASEHGAKEIVSVERCDNRAAINLEHEMGFGIRVLDAGNGEVIAIKSLR